MNMNNELAYSQGKKYVYTRMLREALEGLEYKQERGFTWEIERNEALAVLRDLCEQFGDNDWDDSLHLADIIGKHLGKYLHE